MTKGMLIGFFVGAAITAGVLKAMDRGADAPAPGPSTSPSSSSGASGASESDTKGLRDEIAALRVSVEGKKGELAELEKARATATAEPAKKRSSWKEIVPRIAQMFKPREGGMEEPDEDMQTAMIEMFALLGQIAEEYGVTMDEAAYTPEGLPAMLTAMLGTLEPPATAAQLEEAERLKAAYAESYAAFQKERGDLTRLEKKVKLQDMASGFQQSLTATMTDGQKETLKTADMLGMFGGMSGGHSYHNGTREKVTESLTKDWAKALKFEDSQAALLRPYVEGYMSEVERLIQDAGPGDYKDLQRRRTEAMLAVQKKMASSMTMTQAQTEALRNWATEYNWYIQPEGAQVPSGIEED